MNSLPHPDNARLEAAQGWLELDNPLEASEELARISPENQTHPDVLEVLWRLNAKAKKWEECMKVALELTTRTPERGLGWLQRAYGLHMLQRTVEAREILLSVVDRFKTDASVSYYLAFYCCKLGQLEEARQWLRRAFRIAASSGRRYLKLPALIETDLQSTWPTDR